MKYVSSYNIFIRYDDMKRILKDLENYCRKNSVEAKPENLDTCLKLFEVEENKKSNKIRNIFIRTMCYHLAIWNIGGIVKRKLKLSPIV